MIVVNGKVCSLATGPSDDEELCKFPRPNTSSQSGLMRLHERLQNVVKPIAFHRKIHVHMVNEEPLEGIVFDQLAADDILVRKVLNPSCVIRSERGR
jgi:hypothetical protein